MKATFEHGEKFYYYYWFDDDVLSGNIGMDNYKEDFVKYEKRKTLEEAILDGFKYKIREKKKEQINKILKKLIKNEICIGDVADEIVDIFIDFELKTI